MALNKTTLSSEIKQAFETAKNTKPPDDPQNAGELQDKILEQLSQDIANAIDKFIREGVVTDMTFEVKDKNGNLIGTATQKDNGKIK